jgi:hypothetical protein
MWFLASAAVRVSANPSFTERPRLSASGKTKAISRLGRPTRNLRVGDGVDILRLTFAKGKSRNLFGIDQEVNLSNKTCSQKTEKR